MTIKAVSLPEKIISEISEADDKRIHLYVLLRYAKGAKANKREVPEVDSGDETDPVEELDNDIKRSINRTQISGDDLRSSLKMTAINSLKSITKPDPHNYDPGYKIQTGEWSLINSNEVPSSKEILEKIKLDNDVFNLTKQYGQSENKEGSKFQVHGLIIEYAPNIFGFIRLRNGSFLASTKFLLHKIPIKLTDGQVYEMKKEDLPTLFLPSYIDSLKFGDDLYIFNRRYFEQFFDYVQELNRKIREGEKTFNTYVNDFHLLKRKCRTREKIRKLYTGLQNLESGNFDLRKVKKLVERKGGLTVKFIDGKFDVKKSDIDDLLTILNESYVRGEFTGNEYFSNSKRRA